ncbi:hypothetical protein EC988_009530, partial [Linderina pennispora]
MVYSEGSRFSFTEEVKPGERLKLSHSAEESNLVAFSLPRPPTFATVEAERLHRKQRLVAAFRIFSKLGLDEGIAGHLTCRDPEHPDLFWVNPFGKYFGCITIKDLLLVDHKGTVVYGSSPVNAAAFVIHSKIHEAHPEAVAACHSHSLHGKAFS